MKVWIIWAIPEDTEYYDTTIIKTFDSEEKAKNFIRKNTKEEDPEAYRLYSAIENDEEIGGYSYEALEVE